MVVVYRATSGRLRVYPRTVGDCPNFAAGTIGRMVGEPGTTFTWSRTVPFSDTVLG